MVKDLMTLYGINSVRERLYSNPASVQKVFLEQSFKNKDIEALIKKYRISFERVSPKALSRIKAAKGLQKVVAKVEPFKYYPIERLLGESGAKSLVVVFLDNINDPQNIGVIIRTLACFGGFGIVLPKKHTCGINDTVMHVASGGENYVPVARVKSLSTAVEAAREKGYMIAGSIASEDAENIQNVSFSFPLGVVFGSEGEGIRKSIRGLLDLRVCIPMEGAPLSLNVNNACAIFCYNILRQRKGW